LRCCPVQPDAPSSTCEVLTMEPSAGYASRLAAATSIDPDAVGPMDMGARFGTINTTASTGQPAASGFIGVVAEAVLCAGAPVDAVEPDAVDSVVAGAPVVVVVVVGEGRGVVVDVWAGSAVVVGAVVVVPVGEVSVVVGRSAQAGIAATVKTAAAVIPAVNMRSNPAPAYGLPWVVGETLGAASSVSSTPQDCAAFRVILR
jgi:hypothetical protein